MKIYLAGPMRGYPDFNKRAFEYWAAILRDKGHEVFCPSENSAKVWGKEVASNPTGEEGKMGGDVLTIARTCFLIDLTWICHNADAVALLDGWEASKGATCERATALAIGISVRTVREF